MHHHIILHNQVTIHPHTADHLRLLDVGKQRELSPEHLCHNQPETAEL